MSKKIDWEYRNYNVEANQIPSGQDAFEVLGWAFEIYSETSALVCTVVLKSLGLQLNQENLDRAFELGRSKVDSLINEEEFKKRYYCYRWEGSKPDLLDEVVEVNCDEISPGILRSPSS